MLIHKYQYSIQLVTAMTYAVKRAQTFSNSVLISILIIALLILPIIQIGHGAIYSEKTINSYGSIVQTEPTTYVGFSSVCRQQGRTSPYAISAVQEVITLMNEQNAQGHNCNIWRMSLQPQEDTTYTVDWQTYIQYYLDNCPYDLIVDPNHYFSMHVLTEEEWTTAKAHCLEILEYFSSYQDRIWIEPFNEQMTDITARTQEFVTLVRNAGYTNNIVADLFWRPTPISLAFQKMVAIEDPLDKFWTGHHVYFDQGSLSGWQSIMQAGIDAGCKMINTEVGADAREISYFTQSEVDDLSDFLQWCADRGVSNCAWLMYGDYNWPTYESMNLVWPTIS